MIGERRALQIVVVLACIVPISAGAFGVYSGSSFLADHPSSSLQDSHFRYLSGLLLAIGILFLTAVPRIERHGVRFRVLTGIVAVGCLARLAAALLLGPFSASVLFALAMELVVTPGVMLWQRRIQRAVNR